MFHLSFQLFHEKKFVFIIAWLTFNFRPGGKKFNPFGFVPSSVKKKYKKEKVQNPAIVGIYFQLLFRVQPPPPHSFTFVKKLLIPNFLNLQNLNFPSLSPSMKEKKNLLWIFPSRLTFHFKNISTSIIILRHPSNTNCSTKLSMKGTIIESTFNVSLDLYLYFSVLFANRFPLFFIPLVQSFDHYPRKEKKEEKKKKKRIGKADDDQGQNGDKAIGIIAKHYRLLFDRFHSWRVFVARFETKRYRSRASNFHRIQLASIF